MGLDPRRTLGEIPADFTGLGYEISSVSRPGLLSATNQTYIQLVRTLGRRGVIRIGGNTSDDAAFDSDGSPVSSPKGSVITTNNLRQLASFLDATGWQLIWGLNLGSGDERHAVEEAQAVSAAVKDKLLALEIGNEPDLFVNSHRPNAYGYQDYLKEYRRYKSALRAQLPNVPFAGPDVASATDWVSRFAADEGRDLKLLTHHYYRDCAHPSTTLDMLLDPNPKLAARLEKLNQISAVSRLPYRFCETNSFCGGGKQGVSDTFGAALWVLDFMFALAQAGCAGVNMETGVNQRGFISWYSPIGDDERGTYSAKPEYYGMLAFAQASQGQRLALDCDPAGVNLTAYAVTNSQQLALTIINKDRSLDADVSVRIAGAPADGSVLRLKAPSLDSKDGVTLGGSSVTLEGNWKPRPLESATAKDGRTEIHVPAGSAAILFDRRR